MKTTKLFLGCVLTATLFIACNSDTSASKRSGVAQDALPPVQPVPNAKPDIYLYLVTVNNLLLRDQPTKTGSKVVSKFQSGDFVEGTGEVSDKKEEAIIREIPMTEPYYRVVSTTPEQFKGWAFGGALLPVYAGDRRNSPDMGKLSQFALFLKSLNPKKLDSGKKAWDYVKSNFANANGSLADASFIMMEFFLRQMIAEGEFYTMTEKIQWAEEDYNLIDANKFDVNKYPATKSIADNGFSLAVGEGMVFPMVDWQKLNDFFASKVTPPMKAFINQTLLEDKAQAWSDGGIIIPFEQIADRGVFWEKFNRENPYFPMHQTTRESERWMRLVTLNGDSNTPTYDTETNAISEDFKKMWAYVLQKYPGTELAKSVKEISDLAAAEGWKRTKKVEAFQTKIANEQMQ